MYLLSKLARSLAKVDSGPCGTSTGANFWGFMRTMNRDGGGILFEVLTQVMLTPE